MRIALPRWRNLGLGPSRLAAHVAAVRRAVAGGADLVVFPELSLCGYPYAEGVEWSDGAAAEAGLAALAEAAEPLASSPAVARLSALAVERGCAIVFGAAEEDHGRVYDTVVLADADGGVVGYRKAHLTPSERALFASGDEAVVVPLRVGPGRERLLVGLSSCYDKQFPALYQRQRERGAEVSVIASAWSSSLPWPTRGRRRDDVLAGQSLLFDRARAAETGMVVVSANYVGAKAPGASRSFCGGARVVDPLGRELPPVAGVGGGRVWEIDVRAARAGLAAEGGGDFFLRDRVASLDPA